MALYYAGNGVVSNGILRHIRAIFSTILINIDAICVFSFIIWYAVFRYVFPNNMRFEGHLRRMAEIVCSILRVKKP